MTEVPVGTVRGMVTDVDRAPLGGVAVSATSEEGSTDRATATGNNGAYELELLPVGDYEIAFELEGYRTGFRPARVSAWSVVQVDETLEVEEVSEEIVIA